MSIFGDIEHLAGKAVNGLEKGASAAEHAGSKMLHEVAKDGWKVAAGGAGVVAGGAAFVATHGFDAVQGAAHFVSDSGLGQAVRQTTGGAWEGLINTGKAIGTKVESMVSKGASDALPDLEIVGGDIGSAAGSAAGAVGGAVGEAGAVAGEAAVAAAPEVAEAAPLLLL